MVDQRRQGCSLHRQIEIDPSPSFDMSLLNLQARAMHHGTATRDWNDRILPSVHRERQTYRSFRARLLDVIDEALRHDVDDPTADERRA